MGLFSKREPCPLCGGKVKGLLPWKIEGHCICNECHGMVDLPSGVENNMTLEEFKAYRVYRDENQQLRSIFQISDQLDFGLLDTKFLFDAKNRLLCMDKHLNATIFQGDEITSFAIKEDTTPLFEGTPQGLKRYSSSVPRLAKEMLPQLTMRMMQMQEFRRREREYERRGDTNAPRPIRPYMDIPEPFKSFNVEIHFKHPYWSVYTASLSGPSFDDERPDVNDYVLRYQEKADFMGKLARDLMGVAFPGAPELQIGGEAGGVVQQVVTVGSGDVVAEIQRYKTLVDQGLLTAEEFAAKKKQLLGI